MIGSDQRRYEWAKFLSAHVDDTVEFAIALGEKAKSRNSFEVFEEVIEPVGNNRASSDARCSLEIALAIWNLSPEAAHAVTTRPLGD